MSEQAVRLSKRMVELGLCSRREADAYIEQGLVRVDGEVAATLGCRVRPEQRVELTGQAAARHDGNISLLLHRPQEHDGALHALIDAGSQARDDTSGFSFLPRHRQQLAGVGAVEDGYYGLAALTQDKKLLAKLAECEMEFLVQVDHAPTLDELHGLLHGMKLDGKPLRNYKASRQSDRQLRFVIHKPLPQQLLRMCRQADIEVEGIRCIRIGRIALGKLPAGQWRYLQSFERF